MILSFRQKEAVMESSSRDIEALCVFTGLTENDSTIIQRGQSLKVNIIKLPRSFMWCHGRNMGNRVKGWVPRPAAY